MDVNNKNLFDQLDFLEFRQNIIFLKPPQHSTQLFYELTLEDYLRIRDFTKSYIIKIENKENTSLNDFEKKLISIVSTFINFKCLTSKPFLLFKSWLLFL